jgi:hypothetical protein
MAIAAEEEEREGGADDVSVNPAINSAFATTSPNPAEKI